MGLTKTQSGGLEDESVTLAKLLHGDGSSDGKFLRANNGADPTFETVSGTTINNNADNRVITGSGTANTLNGESGLTYDGSVLQVNGDGQFTGNDGTANQLKWDKSDDSLYFRDNVKSQFGTGGDLKIYHDGSKSHLKNSTGAIEYSSVDHKFFNAANNSEYARIDADGLKFNGDTTAANALDDYEEGTFTPAWNGGSGGVSSISYGTTNAGSYTKVGRMVTVTGRTDISSVSGGSGFWYLSNMPFNVNGGGKGFNAVGSVSLENTNFANDTTYVIATMEQNNNNMHLHTVRDNASLGTGVSPSNGAMTVQFTITYQTA